jgi:RNA 2',3'-cyclic 3'-phosphodiesterase
VTERARARRLFAGIELDDAARAACASVAAQLLATGFAAKYARPESLHVTLAFLGNVDPARCDALSDALLAARGPRFEIRFDRLGAFPHERRPRVVFVGARDQGSGFRGLAGRVREVYRGAGFTFEDDPLAHVTIARVRESHRPLPMLELEPIPLTVAAVTLFESVFDKERNVSRYEVLFRLPLREERAGRLSEA